MKATPILLTVLALFVTTAFCVALVRVAGAQDKEVAAWAQAVGSVFAVGAAIWAAHHATGAQERTAKKARIDQIMGIAEAESLTYSSIEELRRSIRAQSQAETLAAFDRVEMQRWQPLKRFIQMPIERWPSARLYAEAMKFDLAISSVIDELQGGVFYYEDGVLQPPVWDGVERGLNRLDSTHATFRDVLADLLRE